MALRAAQLRSRYAKIILKANTFLAHGDKADLVLLQKEKESLKRQQREEKFKTEAAQTRAAEAASRTELKTQREQERKAASRTELKKQREQERKAARLALEQMERTVEIDDNLVSLKDLNDMLRGRWSDTDPAVVLGPIEGIHVGNVLQRLGVSLKDGSILNGDIEEGEITS
ncbi:transcription factor GTE11-like [Actinidia eriantha]|uniref:transcription factor GTE11-like n=1 Tax=Actinidia eriantha TaxID=165200 RepID=UPI002587AEF7|nr:transcription factor GTE11-like [Actinidia eriantha]